MKISLVPSPTNLFQPPSPVAKATSVIPLPTISLRPEQLLRALVVAKQADTPILEMGGERFKVTSPRPLQIGQVLDLRILQTGGRIEALVMNSQLQDRLAKRLPLLTRPFDWYGLLDRLQRPEAGVSLRPVQTQQLQQLQQLLAPGGRDVSHLGQQLDKVADQLRPFVVLPGKSVVVPAVPGQPAAGSLFPAKIGVEPLFIPPSAPLFKEGQVPTVVMSAAAGEVAEVKTLEGLLGKLRQQVTLLVEQGERETSRNWQRATSELLVQVREQVDRPMLQTTPQVIRLSEWQQTLQQLQQHPQTPPHIAKVAEQLMTQLTQLAAFSEVTSQKSDVAPEVRQALVALQQVVQEVKTLQVATGGSAGDFTEGMKPLPQALLGRIEGVVQQLQQLQQLQPLLQLPQASGGEGVSASLQVAIGMMTSQLQQLANASSVPARGEALGFLSQFLGLHLERELLYDKQKTALNNLKLSLLVLQKAAGEDVREPLQRLELFQLATARFGELHMQFLPLPFSDLEEGFMLAQRQDGEQGKEKEAGESYQVSLSLRLSALGNMRVDMQFDRQQGVVINLACDTQTKADFIKTHGEELKSALSEVRLRDLSFSTDAAHPVQLLRQRLLPQQTSLLDTRA